MTLDLTILLPGDELLYYDGCWVDIGIAVKTSGRVGHIELYAGGGISQASRNGIGVGRYALRTQGLIAVRRPSVPVDWNAGERWFDIYANGQKYDFKGLFCFYLAVKQGSLDRMFCSEFALRRYRASGFEPFNPDQDADRTAPFDFWKAGTFQTIWQKEGFNV